MKLNKILKAKKNLKKAKLKQKKYFIELNLVINICLI